MMKINMTQKHAFDQALRELFRECHIDIYSIEEHYDIDTPEKYGVNWSAQGTQPADVAVNYATNLLQAAKVAEALNKLEIVIDWDNRPGIMNHMKETYKTAFHPSFVEILRRGEIRAIEYALNAFEECYCNKEV